MFRRVITFLVRSFPRAGLIFSVYRSKEQVDSGLLEPSGRCVDHTKRKNTDSSEEGEFADASASGRPANAAAFIFGKLGSHSIARLGSRLASHWFLVCIAGISFFEPRLAQAQNWDQLGDTLAPSGHRVSISGDGNRLGAGHYHTTFDEGYVELFSWQEGNWLNEAQFQGNREDHQTSVSLSFDGETFVIGSHLTGDTGRGRVEVKVRTESGFESRAILNGETTGDQFGKDFALSADGNALAVFSPRANSGHARVYVYRWSRTQQIWLGKGQPIDVFELDNLDGGSVAIDMAGSRVAIGGRGALVVFEWSEVIDSWVQLGSVIQSCDAGDALGSANSDQVDISLLGDVVSVGSNCNVAGKVKVFRLGPGNPDWEQVGETIEGDAGEQLTKNALNFDGSRLAVGGTEYSDGRGRVRVFEFNGDSGNWNKVASGIVGQDQDEGVGYDIDISAAGTRVAIGAYASSFLRTTRVYSLETSSLIHNVTVAGAGTNLTYGGENAVPENGLLLVTASPSHPSEVSGWNTDCPATAIGETVLIGPVTTDCQVLAEVDHLVSLETPTGGSISPGGSQAVGHGGYLELDITPDEGFQLSSVTGTCTGSFNDGVFVVGPVNQSCSVDVAFSLTVEVYNASGGSLSPSGDQQVVFGSSVTLTAVPDQGKTFAGFTSSCPVVQDGNVLTVGPITVGCWIQPEFEEAIFTVTPIVAGTPASTSVGGTVSPATSLVIDWMEQATFTITPDPQVTFSIGGSCPGVLDGFEYTVGPIEDDCQLEVTFDKFYSIAPVLQPGDFTVSPSGPVSIYENQTALFTVSPELRRVVTGVSDASTCTDVAQNGVNSWRVGPNSWLLDDRTCQVSWDAAVTWLVDQSVSDGGSISPAGAQYHLPGTKVRYSPIVNSGYVFDTWGGTCLGTPVGQDWEIEVGEEDCTITASFSRLPAAPTISTPEYGDSFLRLTVSDGNGGGDPDSSVETSCVGEFSLDGDLYLDEVITISGPGAFGGNGLHVVEVTGLINGVEYACSAITYNAAGDSPESNTVRETPRGTPYAPVINDAVGGFGSITLQFQADDRGAPIEYVNTVCEAPLPDGISARKSASWTAAEQYQVYTGGVGLYEVDIDDLPNGLTYTCTVSVENSEGVSPLSSPSPSVRTGKVCEEQSYSFESQSEVDNFIADCSEIPGNLEISGVSNIDKLSAFTDLGGNLRIRSTQLANFDALAGLAFGSGNLEILLNDNLESLSGFQSLTSLQGTLSVSDSNLTSLEGLDNLSFIGGGVSLSEMTSLVSLSGLESLQAVGGDFSLDSSLVSSLQGLGALQTVSGGFALSYNPNLSTLTGLENLTSIGGQLYVGDAGELTSLSGLGGLQAIGGELVLYQLPKLTNIDAVSTLESIGSQVTGGIQITGATLLPDIDGLINVAALTGSIVLTDNAALRDVDGLYSLEGVVPGSVIISNNGSLRTLDGLGKIESVGFDFTVTNNVNLSNCAGAAVLLGYPEGPPSDLVAGDIEITGNASGCNVIQEIFDSIQGPSKPVIDSAVAGNESVTLSYTATAGDPAFPINEYFGVCEGPGAEFSESPVMPILDNQPAERTHVISGFDPVRVAPDVTVEIDISHDDPIEVTVQLISPAGTVVTLWDKEDTPEQSIVATYDLIGSETFPGESGDGPWRLRVTDDETGPIAKEGVLNSWSIALREKNLSSSITSTMLFAGLTNGRLYSCSVSPKTNLSIYPVSDPIGVTPEAPSASKPAAPSIARIYGEDGAAVLWIEVVDDGGSSVNQYQATCTDGTNTYTGTSTTNRVVISGLSNGISYTCTAAITTEWGRSDDSSVSIPVVPEEAPIPGLPLWLLYEVTK